MALLSESPALSDAQCWMFLSYLYPAHSGKPFIFEYATYIYMRKRWMARNFQLTQKPQFKEMTILVLSNKQDGNSGLAW